MTALSSLPRIIVLLVIACALGACSAIRLGYDNLGEIAYWWLDSYVDFTQEQSVRVREDLARLHRWHRRHELAPIVGLLQRMEALVPGDISPAQACGFVAQFRERLNAATQQAEPAVVTLALSLAPEQLLHLERKYDKNNADYTRDWVGLEPQALKDKRFKQFVERSEMVYGQLDEPQRGALRRQLERSIFDPRRMLEERKRRQQDALDTLRRIAGQPIALGDARSLLRGYLARAQESPDVAYRAYQQALIDESCRSFSVLHNSTSLAQREAAVRQLRAYQRDLLALVGDNR